VTNTRSLVSADLLYDRHVQTLPHDEFREKFIEAIEGGVNEFTPFIKGPYSDRPTIPGWQGLRRVVLERDGYVCVYCGSDESLECDHIHPLSRGGPSTLENLATACRSCNRAKWNRTVDEWTGMN
jgi:hypothetical protein